MDFVEAEDIPCQPCFLNMILRVVQIILITAAVSLSHLTFSQWNLLEIMCRVG